MSCKKKPRILIQALSSGCYQPSSAWTYSLLRNDPPSRSPSVRLSLLGYTFPTLITFVARRLRDFPRSSAHSLPSILTLITSMSLAGHIPFLFSCKICFVRISFPVLQAGHPTSPPPLVHCIPGWTLPASPSDSPSRVTPCQSFSSQS
jgi:hypothetical protein